MSALSVEVPAVVSAVDNDVEKVSPFHDAYSAPNPIMYMKVGEQKYRPTQPVVPDYCRTILDCAALFGNTSLYCQFGWDFKRSCEFWIKDVPLTDAEREQTLLGRRIKMIGLDLQPRALAYSKKMNIIDQEIVQDFGEEASDATKNALREADLMVMQQCMSHMPTDNISEWLKIFVADRSRSKRFIYDHNPFFDSRDMSPETILKAAGVEPADKGNWESTHRFYAYREKTEEEFQESQVNGRDMCVNHYVVDFKPSN